MANTPYEELLLSNIEGLHSAIVQLRTEQASMKDDLHAAVLDNTTRLTAVETRIGDVEKSMAPFKEEVKKEARRWGTVGGVVTVAATMVAELLKSAFKH